MISDFLALDDVRMTKVKRAARIVELVVLITVLFLAGSFTGYAYRDNVAVERRTAMEKQNAEQLAALNRSYQESLVYLSGKMTQTAADANSAVSTAEQAALIAQRAAQTANQASQRSTQALANSSKVPEPTREQINKAVSRANRGIPVQP